ncbi:MAG: peptidylprolyl isomerase [Gallionellaceae bacterium]|nr:peptidylprolyl isomerase [Gallionellaceae bacterium]MDD5365389.1 peptidylprolyl isomerase [Gallionellaceae bacterium]
MNSSFLSNTRRLLILIAAACLSLPALSAPLLVDRIVAVVDNSVITANELNRKVEQTLSQLASRNTPPPPRSLLTKQLLERMITEKVLLQTAADSNIKIDGEMLDRTISRIAAQNNLDLPAFRAALEKDGVDFDQFRDQIRSEMTISRLREREVDNRVVVTDAEIDNYLTNRKLDPSKQTDYNLAHILILAPEGASPEKLAELRAKAEKALAELKGGANFAQISAAYSDAQNALQGGGMDWRSEAKLPDLFVDAVKDLKPGEITPVLHSANGFHILKLIDKRGVDTHLVVSQTHARHILVKTNELVTDKDAFARLSELRDRLINGGANFEELAKLHSDDLSAAKGGDLGWLNPGDTVPPFEKAMNALAVGGISEPIKSPFGWHLIQVVERRDQDVSEERQKLEARRAIRERKSDEAFDDWVRLMRDQAYVEYRLEE